MGTPRTWLALAGLATLIIILAAFILSPALAPATGQSTKRGAPVVAPESSPAPAAPIVSATESPHAIQPVASSASPTSTPHSAPSVTVTNLTLTHEHLSWSTNDGQEQSLQVESLIRAYPENMPATSKKGYRILRAEISPSERFIAFLLAGAGPSWRQTWHLGIVDAEGIVRGLYSAAGQPCFIYEYVWRPDEQGIVVELAGGGTNTPPEGCARVVLLDPATQVVYDVQISRLKNALFVSPDTRWVGLYGRSGPEEDWRVEFVWLADPTIRLDVPIDVQGTLWNELWNRWARATYKHILSAT